MFTLYIKLQDRDVVCLNLLHDVWSQFFHKKMADIRVSKTPQGTMVNGL